ncbi:MAG: IS4 family transposase [Verrucomicrobiota bacterium]
MQRTPPQLGPLETRLMSWAQMRGIERATSAEIASALRLTVVQCRQLLDRMNQRGSVVQLQRGLYLLPVKLPPGGKWTPSPAAILRHLFEAKGADWQETGACALHDNKRAREVCASIAPGEIVVFDKAYVDFAHLAELDARGVQWVTRAKDTMKYHAKRNLTTGHENVVKDQLVVLKGKHKGMQVRRVEAWVEVDDKWQVMVFITNNLAWSPRSVCDLYRRRWDIEVFFKQVKQSLKLSGFLGHSANAVRWQVYAALLVYVLLRFQAHLSAWGHSFTRLFTVTRSALWERLDLLALLKSYGTASGQFKVIGALNDAWLPGFTPAKT